MPALKLGEQCCLCIATPCAGTKATSIPLTLKATSFVGSLVTQPPAHERLWVRQWESLVNDLEKICDVSILPTGEILVLQLCNGRLVRFQDRCGHLVCGDIHHPQGIFCSPNAVVYVLAKGGKVVQKVVGPTLQTVMASKRLPEHLHFRARAIVATKDEVIYITDNRSGSTRVLRFNPAESLEPVVVGQVPAADAGQPGRKADAPYSLFVAEDEKIYVGEYHAGKVLAFHPGDTTPSEVLQCPDAMRPIGLVVHHRSLYVSMVEDLASPTAGGVYEHLLPPVLQLE